MTVQQLYQFLEDRLPRSLSCGWDNDGLSCCPDPLTPVRRVLISLDPTEDAVRVAAEEGYTVLLTHHPLLFRGLKAVNGGDTGSRKVIRLIQAGVTAMSFHTRLDAADGGVNDTLAAVLGLTAVQTILLPGKDYGLLRHGTVERQPLGDFLALVKKELGCPGLRYADAGKPVRHVAVGGGACGSELMDAVRAGCDTFVTSDVKYNQFRDAYDLGLNLIDAGHFATENPVTAVLARKLKARFPEVEVISSRVHRDVTQFFE